MDEQKNGETTKTEDNLEQKLKECEAKRDEYLSGWQRAKADFINYRKDELRRLEEMARYGNEDLITEFIAVLDDFDLGLVNLEKAGPIEKGIYLLRSRIEDVLKKRGLERISIKPGETFDTATAESLGEVESNHPAGTIAEEIQPGYKLYDKIARPARVKISKNKISNV